jgi:hypothetical protein
MAIWSLMASPLILGNDLRNVSAASKAIILNPDAIAVDQDPLGQQGLRLSNSSSDPQQVWYRNLADGSVAVGLYNYAGTPQPPIPTTCPTWTHTTDGYYESCGGAAGNVGDFTALTPAQAQAACCTNAKCAGFSFGWDDAGKTVGSGYYKGNAMCGFEANAGYQGWYKPNQIPSSNGTAVDITVTFADINLFGSVEVYDIWARASVGTFTTSYTAPAVPYHGTAFLKLTPK